MVIIIIFIYFDSEVFSRKKLSKKKGWKRSDCRSLSMLSSKFSNLKLIEK